MGDSATSKKVKGGIIIDWVAVVTKPFVRFVFKRYRLVIGLMEP
jgi:hypothetical protein